MPFGPQLGPPTGETASATPAPRAQRGFRPPPLSSPLGAATREASPGGLDNFDHQTSFVSELSSENEYEWTTPATSMAGASGRGSIAAPWDPPPRAPWPGLNEAQLSVAIAGGVGSMSGVAGPASSAGQPNPGIDPLSPTSPSPFSPLAAPSKTAGAATRAQESNAPNALALGKSLPVPSPFSNGSSQKSKTFPKSPGAGSSLSTRSSTLHSKSTFGGKGTGMSRAETTSTRNEEVKVAVGACGYTLFYVVAFCVHWFGSLRFVPDHDSDDEFDPEDVQCLVEQGSEWFRNFLVPDKKDIAHQKSTASSFKGTPSTPYSNGNSLNNSVGSEGTFEQAHHTSDGGVSTGNPTPIGVGFRNNPPAHLGLDSGAGALDSDERNAFGSYGFPSTTGPATASNESQQIFMSQQTTENVYMEKLIKKRLKQHPPYFVCCEAIAIFALWFIFALQTSHYDVVGRAILYEESDLLPVSPNLWIGDKSVKDCEDACNEQDACQGVAYFDGPTSTCALLQYVREGSCETDCYGQIGWQLLKRTSKNIEARMSQIAGLDNVFPGDTLLQAHDRFCNSFEYQLWRWWTYQFTHGKISHVLENCLYILIFGVSLEGLQGSFGLFLMFNLGVISGGLWCTVFDSHAVVIGASGGCYALIGIHVANLIMNWREFKFKAPTLLVIVVTFTASFISYIIDQEADSRTSNSKVANSTHIGGLVGGLAIGILWVTNIRLTEKERALKLCIGLTFSVLVLTCLCWFFTNPFPATRNAFFGTGDIEDYCWLGYACVPPQYGGNCGSAFECVSCTTKECVARWYSNTTQFQVGTFNSFHSCNLLAHLDLDPGGFSG